MTQILLFLKWTILVWLNAIFGSFLFHLFGSHKTYYESASWGIICGAFTIVVIYTAIDYQLLKKNAVNLRRSLLIAVFLKTGSQLIPGVMYMDITIISMSQIFFFKQIPFISSYLATLFTGILLSIIIALLTALIRPIVESINKAKV